jgi:hypothetical protein
MSRFTVVVYPDGRTLLTTEELLHPEAVATLGKRWAEWVADAGRFAVIPDATVRLIGIEFTDGGIVVTKP